MIRTHFFTARMEIQIGGIFLVRGFQICLNDSRVKPKTSRRLRDGFVFERGENAFENPFAVVAAEQRFAGAFGMRHQAGHVALLVADAGDVLQRAVGIRAVG